MKKELFNKKNILVLIGIIVIIIAIILLIAFNPFAKKQNEKGNKKGNEIVEIKSKEDLIEVINNVSNTYYQEYYYTLVTKDDLKEHTEFGINISLNSIGLAMGLSEDLEKNLKKYECDKDATKIHFYPTSPFKETDYTIKTDIVCKK